MWAVTQKPVWIRDICSNDALPGQDKTNFKMLCSNSSECSTLEKGEHEMMFTSPWLFLLV